MNSIKKLSVLFAAMGLAFAASAASSVYWASVITAACKVEGVSDTNPSTANAANYSVYLCAKTEGMTVESLNTALTTDKSAWATVQSSTMLTAAEYGRKQYSFTQYFGKASDLEGSYLAVALYNSGDSYAFRVFDNVATYGSNLVFDDGGSTTATSTLGAWTATTVPEPTSALLMLLGLAGLALKRKQA